MYSNDITATISFSKKVLKKTHATCTYQSKSIGRYLLIIDDEGSFDFSFGI